MRINWHYLFCLAIVIFFISLPLTSFALVRGVSFEQTVREAASIKCNYAPASLVDSWKEGSITAYQFSCGSMFNVKTVRCQASQLNNGSIIYMCE